MANLAAGLQELELPFRATLELRYRRGLPDDTIAAVAGFDERVIQRQRQRALAWLAQRTAVRGPDAIETVEENLRALSPAAWAGEPEPPEPEAEDAAPEPQAIAAEEPAPEAEVEPATEAEVEPAEPDTPGPRASIPPPLPAQEEQRDPEPDEPIESPLPSTPAKPKSRGARTEVSPRTAVGLLALFVAVVALVFILSSGGSDGDGGAPAPVTPSPETGTKSDSKQGKGEGKADDEKAAPAAGPVAMEPVPGADLGGGGIEVSLTGSGAEPELEITLNGLPEPEGEYRGWLYNSLVDSRSLGRARSGDGVIAATLPEDWQDYEFLDISVQEQDSITHSGESIARIPIADLPAP